MFVHTSFLSADQSFWSGTWKPKFWCNVDHIDSIMGSRTTMGGRGGAVISKTSCLNGITGAALRICADGSVCYVCPIFKLWLFFVSWYNLQSLSSESWPTWPGLWYLCIGSYFHHWVLIMMLAESGSTKCRQPSPITIIHCTGPFGYGLYLDIREGRSAGSGVRLLGPSPVSAVYSLCKQEWAIQFL